MLAKRVRWILIDIAKVLPFVICVLVCLSYSEAFIALACDSYGMHDNSIIPFTPISWFIGNIYTYGWYTILALAILAIAMETCIWNRLAILYLALHLVFKQFIEQIELYEYQVYILCLVNISISTILIMKGIKIRKGGTIING